MGGCGTGAGSGAGRTRAGSGAAYHPVHPPRLDPGGRPAAGHRPGHRADSRRLPVDRYGRGLGELRRLRLHDLQPARRHSAQRFRGGAGRGPRRNAVGRHAGRPGVVQGRSVAHAGARGRPGGSFDSFHRHRVRRRRRAGLGRGQWHGLRGLDGPGARGRVRARRGAQRCAGGAIRARRRAVGSRVPRHLPDRWAAQPHGGPGGGVARRRAVEPADRSRRDAVGGPHRRITARRPGARRAPALLDARRPAQQLRARAVARPRRRAVGRNQRRSGAFRERPLSGCDDRGERRTGAGSQLVRGPRGQPVGRHGQRPGLLQ